MKLRTFLQFVSPSVALMIGLMAVPLAITFFLSMRNCVMDMEVVTVQQSGPFGTQEVITQRAKLGADGKAMQACEFEGGEYYRKVLGIDAASRANPDAAASEKTVASPTEKPANEFFAALKFTLTYTAATTPFVLVIGFLLALGVNNLSNKLKGFFIAASLLPFIITPVVAALSIKWIFRDNGLIPYLLSFVGIEIYWMAQAWSARLLIVLYGIWHVVPFAFIVFYAGLQSVPQDSLEAATIDGASRWQKFIYVTLPHMMPLVVFVLLIHLMDSYRVFEPVIVLTQGAFTTSVQYLTYFILLQENNPYKASAASVLTIGGVLILLVPLLVKTYREQRRGF